MAKSSRHDESVLQPATSKSNSLRTTVPVSIVNMFELRKGDKLSWGVENGSVVVRVVKQEDRTVRA